jgi:hypothetical protein
LTPMGSAKQYSLLRHRRNPFLDVTKCRIRFPAT